MAQESPLIVATRRLIEKQRNVSELLPATGSHLKSLESLENDIETTLRAAKGHIEFQFTILRDALDRREERLLRDLQEAASKYTECVTLYKKKTCDVMNEAEKALGSVNDLLLVQEQGPFFKGYTSTSQTLEESIMEMLLLADSQPIDEMLRYVALLNETKLDISDQLKSLQELEIPVGLHHPASERLEEHISDTSSQISENKTTPEPCDPSSSPKSRGSAEMSGLLESIVVVKTSDASETSRGSVNPEVRTDPDIFESCSQLDEDTTEVSLMPEANSTQGSSYSHDEQLQDSSAIPMTVDNKTEALTEGCEGNLLDDRQPSLISEHEHTNRSPNPQNQKEGTGQNSESECFIEQVEGGESCDTVPAPTECVHAQPAKGIIVADEKQEETLTDDLSDGGSYSSPPLVGSLADYHVAPGIEYLSIPPGSQLTVLVTQVTSPSSFCAQPYGPELIQLMEEMGAHYDGLAEQGDRGGLLTPPGVGDFCCAQFTEDGCWYRARVEAVEQLSNTEGTSVVTTSHTIVKVKYVDYGNHEQLPLTYLRPLEARFCQLACQGLVCSLANVHPVLHPPASKGTLAPQSTWPPECCKWFVKLVVGKSANMTVLHCGGCNDLTVDINLPSDVLLSAESLASFPVPVHSIANLLSYRRLVTPLSLASFMVSAGIAGLQDPSVSLLLEAPLLLSSSDVSQAAFVNPAFTVPTLNSTPAPSGVLATAAVTTTTTSPLPPKLQHSDVKAIGLSAVPQSKPPTSDTRPTHEVAKLLESNCEGDHCDSVHTTSMVTPTLSSSMQPELMPEASSSVPTIVPQLDRCFHEFDACNSLGKLPALLLQLGSSDDFTLLMSHIVSPSKFFVHLVEEKSACEMVSLTEGLNSHYSQHGNRIPLLPEQVEMGALCCIQSPDDGQWCRGLITSVRKAAKSSLKEVHIFYVDYGDSTQTTSEAVMLLDDTFHHFSAQCICCALDAIQAPHSSGAKVKQSPFVNTSSPSVIGFQSSSNDETLIDATEDSDTVFHSEHDKCKAVSLVQTCELGRSYHEHLTADDQQWSAETVKIFQLLTSGKPLVAVVKVDDAQSSLLTLNSLDVVTVNLYDTTGESDVHINSVLVETGLAETMSGDSLETYRPVSSHVVPASPHIPQQVQKWNPMESDFLAERNIYEIDDEDTTSALHGYRSTSRVCRYYTSGEACYLGNKCPYLHLQEGIPDKQLEDTYANPPDKLVLPDVGNWVVIVVTAMVSATKFYIQMPLGAKSPLSTGSVFDSKADLLSHDHDLDALIEEMNLYYSRQVFSDRDVLHPHTGQTVAVRYSADQQWYRGQVMQCVETTVQVYYLDFGNIDWIPQTALRVIKPEFMLLPFQAVECHLAGVQMSEEIIADLSKEKEAESEFEKLVIDKMLAAQVIWKSRGNALGLFLYDTSGPNRDAGVNLGELLISKGVYMPCDSCPVPFKELHEVLLHTLPG